MRRQTCVKDSVSSGSECWREKEKESRRSVTVTNGGKALLAHPQRYIALGVCDVTHDPRLRPQFDQCLADVALGSRSKSRSGRTLSGGRLRGGMPSAGRLIARRRSAKRPNGAACSLSRSDVRIWSSIH